MTKTIGIIALVVGVILLIYGFQAGDSLASEVKEVVDGTPTDETMLFMISGGVAAALGVGLLFFGTRK